MLKASWHFGKRGQPAKLTVKQVTGAIKVMRGLIKKAKAAYEIPLAMIMKHANIKCCERTLRTQLHKRGIRFRRMRQKPLLTKEDIIERYAFACKYKDKPKAFWRKVHIYIDLKTFPVYPNAKARKVAAQRTVRGAYRGKGGGLGEGYVVVPKNAHYGSFGKSAKIACGIGNGKVLMWHEVKSKWSGATAAEMYEGPVLEALQKGWPGKKTFTLLEDNERHTNRKTRKLEIQMLF
jgi:hypothetical protein